MATSLFLITGNDGPTIRAEARKVIARLAGPTPDPFRCAFFKEGDERGPLEVLQDVLDAVQTPPFLGDSKVVWLQDFSAFDKELDKVKDASQPEQKALASLAAILAQGLPDDIQLVIDGLGADLGNPLAKAVSTHGKVQVCMLPDLTKGDWRATVTRMVQEGAASRKLRLDEEIMAYLLEVVGVDTGRIPQELEKILCYAGETPTLADVMDVCVGDREAGFFAMQEAIDARDLSKCLRTIAQTMYHARNPGGEAIRLVRQIGRHARELLHARLMMHHLKQENPKALGARIKALNAAERERFAGNLMLTLNPYRAEKIIAGAQRYQGPELVRAIAAIAVADRNLVSSSLDGRTVLETMVTRLVAPG